MNQFESNQPDIRKFRPFIFLGIGIILVFIFWSKITVNIQSGHAGLIFRYFNNGIDKNTTPMGQGFHFIAPWNHVIDYEIRQQEVSETMTVLSF